MGNECEVRDVVTCTQRTDAKPDTAQHSTPKRNDDFNE